MSTWHVYFLRLKDGRIYVGHTNNLNRRQAEHNIGKGSRTSQVFGVGKIFYDEEYSDRISAVQRERQLKRWTRAKKEALATGDRTRLKALARSHKDGSQTESAGESNALSE